MKRNGKETQEPKSKKTEDMVNKVISEVSEKGKVLFHDGLETAKTALEQNAHAIKDKAHEMGEKSIEEISEEVKNQVKRSPLQSLGIAFGVGLILGYILKSD